MTSNPEHDDSVVRMFTCVCGKGEKVVRKIASQVHCKGGCSNSTNLKEVFRFMSCRLYLTKTKRNETKKGHTETTSRTFCPRSTLIIFSSVHTLLQEGV